MLPSRGSVRPRCTRRRVGPCTRIAWLTPLVFGWGCTALPGLPSPAPPAVPVRPAKPGAIHGRLVPVPTSGHSVVYAAPQDGTPVGSLPHRTVRIGGENHLFEPAFLAVGVGQTVNFRNEDGIFHSVFSSSEPNAFDVGMLGKGEERGVQFERPGIVRLYCSLHENESAELYVVPSPFFGMVAPSGEVVLSGLPPGRYELRTWSESIPRAPVRVTVRAGTSTDIEIPIAAGGEGE